MIREATICLSLHFYSLLISLPPSLSLPHSLSPFLSTSLMLSLTHRGFALMSREQTATEIARRGVNFLYEAPPGMQSAWKRERREREEREGGREGERKRGERGKRKNA